MDILISRAYQKSGSQKFQIAKDPLFFITSKNFKNFQEDILVNEIEPKSVNSLSLQCSGHGSFNKKMVAIRFLQYFKDAIKNLKQLKKLKIKLSGFDLAEDLYQQINQKGLSCKNLVHYVVQNVKSVIQNIASLEIRVSNAQNCSLKDFQIIMGLGFNYRAQNLSNLSLQFSDWSFAYKEKPRDLQPTLKEFIQSIQRSTAQTMDHSLQPIKKIRLEVSTWYYTQQQYSRFLSSVKAQNYLINQKQDKYVLNQAGKKITTRQQYFHNEFAKLIKQFLSSVFPNLTSMELDFRNWYKKFQMSQLKSSLSNINNKQKISTLSSISKRFNVSKREMAIKQLSRIQQKIKQQQSEDQQEQDVPKKFDIIIVI